MPDTPETVAPAASRTTPIRAFDTPTIDLDGKVVLITGGTGSFGSAFVSAVLARSKPRKLIIFSRDEQKQYEMAQRLNEADHPALRYFIGDVRDLDRLEMAMREVDYVIHAAALKHVPTAEYNPFECVATNINGAQNVVTAALRTNVERVIALSTDKAANPINLYGATKLASDKIFVAANNLSGERGTQFSVVRYGNVLGSRGSVVPFFQRLIAEGATSLPITDGRMTRFWITLDQGVNFVLSSMAMMQGGEIFVPKVASMRITDLARALAPDCKLENVGIRPGEKLHEILITEDDARETLELEDRYVIRPVSAPWDPAPYDARGGRDVDSGFHYVSDQNDEWIDEAMLHQLLGTCA